MFATMTAYAGVLYSPSNFQRSNIVKQAARSGEAVAKVERAELGKLNSLALELVTQAHLILLVHHFNHHPSSLKFLSKSTSASRLLDICSSYSHSSSSSSSSSPPRTISLSSSPSSSKSSTSFSSPSLPPPQSEQSCQDSRPNCVTILLN